MWFLTLISAVFAKDIVIQPNGTNDALRNAIKQSQSGDRIVLQQGTYAECVSNLGKDIIIFGEKEAQITGNGSCDALLTVSSGEVWVQNLRFQHKETCVIVENRGSILQIEDSQFVSCGNNKAKGGGIRADGGKLEIRTSRFTKNNGEKGGGIHAQNAVINISDSIFSDNIGQIGGAIYSDQSEVTVTKSRIFGNKTRSGGFGAGIAIRNRSVLKLHDITMQNNHAQGKGGAVYLDTSSSKLINKLEIKESEFSDNSASFGSSTGGAIYIRGGSQTTISSSSFSNNISSNSGGAIALHDIGQEIKIKDTKFSKNRARGGNGGAIMIEASNAEKAGKLSIAASQFVDNRAETYGGALSIGNRINPYGSVEIEDAIFKDNRANSSQSGAGGAIYYFSSAPFVLRVRGSEFHNNQAELSGGAIYAYNPQQIDLLDSIFYHNKAMGASTVKPRYGGGVMIDSATVLTVERSRFCHNTASSSGAERVSGTGGGVYLQRVERALFQDSWFWENEAQVQGGGIGAEGSKMSLEKLVFAGNRSGTGGAILAIDGTVDSVGSIFSYTQAGVAVSAKGDFSNNQWYSNADGDFTGQENFPEVKPAFKRIVVDGRCDDDLEIQ